MRKTTSPRSALSLAVILLLSLPAVFLWGCTEEETASPGTPGGTGNLQDPSIIPSVLSTTPADHSTGPYALFSPGDNEFNPNFVVQFDKLINTNALTPASVRVQGFDRPVKVLLSPNYYPLPVFNKSTNGPFDNILAFNIYDSASYETKSLYRVGEIYTVTIDTSITDINGNHMAQPYSFSYTPEPAFRVTTFDPGAGTSGVGLDAVISISFNTQIDATVLPSLHIAPPLSGLWTMNSYDSSSAVFSYTGPLPYSSTFSLSVDAGATDPHGNRTGAAVTSTFTTLPFGVIGTFPDPGQNHAPPTTVVSLYFSGSADTASIRSAFSVNPPTPGLLGYAYFGDGFTFAPLNGLAPATLYTVTLSTTLHATDGTALSSPYSFSFTTDQLGVSSTNPQGGRFNVETGSEVDVFFNSMIDTASAQAAFGISPPVSGQVYAYTGASTAGGWLSFFHSSPFAANVLYTVTISTSVKDIRGNHLPAPYTFTFRTAMP